MQQLGLVVMMNEVAMQAEKLREAQALSEQDSFTELVEAYAMQEGLEPTELMLALEDRGWNRVGGYADTENYIAPNLRRLTILRARMYWLLDPYAAVGIRTWTNYTVGTGVTMKAKDTTVDANLQKFLKSPKNRTMTSAAGQQKHNRRLLIDGEMFFAVFDDDPAPSIRKVDCLEITEFIYDPDDAEIVWAYKRERMLPSGKTDIRYYRSWAFPEQDLSGIEVKSENGSNTTLTPEEDVLLYHLAFDSLHQRGNSLFSSSLAWMTGMRQFLQDRIGITKGLARYIYKLTATGGKKQLSGINSQINAQTKPRMPGEPLTPNVLARENSVAKTFMSNNAVEMTTMPRTTGAGDAKADHKLLRLSVIAGMGITEPYTGDAETGNLASATAMELPMLKQFQTHQKLWADAWSDLAAIVMYFMGSGSGEMEPVEIDADYPPIVEADIAKITTAIVATCAEFPELKQPEVLKLLLVTMGINNVDEVMKAVLITAAANQAKQDNIAKGLNPDGSKKTPAQLASILPTPVVAPAKPAQQKTQPGGQQVAKPVAEALADFMTSLEAEALELEEAGAPPTASEVV